MPHPLLQTIFTPWLVYLLCSTIFLCISTNMLRAYQKEQRGVLHSVESSMHMLSAQFSITADYNVHDLTMETMEAECTLMTQFVTV